MELEKLKKMYHDLLKMEDTDDGIFDFKDALLSSDTEEILKFHFDLLQDNNEDYLRAELFSFFTDREDLEAVEEFLLKKYKENILNDDLKGDIIQLLGHIRSKYAKDLAYENIESSIRNIRYKSIIVLGWVGNEKDIDVLNTPLLKDKDPELRGYAATSMRQIWFNHRNTKDKILHFLKNAILEENAEEALIGIIVTVQELLKKKLGIKESSYGDITGDIQQAKIKTIGSIKNF